MEKIAFWKMSGSGNDFIIIDNRHSVVTIEDLTGFAAQVCRRKMSVGADGLILVESSANRDFKWRFFNSDGSVAEMCGNGARCVARFAHLNGIAGKQMCFETLAGVISASVNGEQVRIQMTDPDDPVIDAKLDTGREVIDYSFVNTGVPHVVIDIGDIEAADVVAVGRRVRWHDHFAPAGTNVNFLAPLDAGVWAVRTYERGVEDETLACGTGITAAALVLARKKSLTSPIVIKSRSGALLKVYFAADEEGFKAVQLEGDARIIYQGHLNPQAWQY